MYKAEADRTLCRMMAMFHRIGIWRNEEESDDKKSFIRMLYFLQYFFLEMYILMGIHQAYVNGDRNQLIFLVEIEIISAIVFVKLAYLLWRKDDLLKFFYDPNVTHCTANCGELVVVNQKIKKIAIFIRGYIPILFVTIIFAILVPLSTIRNEDKLLPFFIHFRVDRSYDVALYAMKYVLASVSCFLCFFYTSTILFIWYIMRNFSIEYKLLGHRFRGLGTTTPSNTYAQELITLICAHNNLFDTVEQFRSCYSVLFLVEIFTGAISICVSTYNLSFNIPENVFEMAIYVGLLCYAFFEIFLLMYLGNEVTIESDRLSYCLFESNWIDQSESTRKNVIIFGEMIKKPHQLAIFIYPMNLEKFTSIVNGAYSMFNILKSIK